MAPPEVILDRYIRTQLRTRPGCSDYVGKLDIDSVEPPEFRFLLHLVQGTMNEALRRENANASGGVAHPPFHFDYIDATAIRNAHAFQFEGYSFIAITLPMVQCLWDTSERLSRGLYVRNALGFHADEVEAVAVHGALFQMQLSFLVSHEYTHHIHGHAAASGVWSEFSQDAAKGNIDSQAEELIADTFAAYLTLANFVRGDGRPGTLQQLGKAGMEGTDGDDVLLNCFLLAVMASFCVLWHSRLDMQSAADNSHPPPPIRINYLIEITKMWCGQFGSVPPGWFATDRLRGLFGAAAEVATVADRQAWDTHIAAIRDAGGELYQIQLRARFEEMRKRGSVLAP